MKRLDVAELAKSSQPTKGRRRVFFTPFQKLVLIKAFNVQSRPNNVQSHMLSVCLKPVSKIYHGKFFCKDNVTIEFLARLGGAKYSTY